VSEEADGELGEALHSTQKVRVCPECGEPKLMRDYEAAEIVCMSCGFVIDEKLLIAGPNGEPSTTTKKQNEAESAHH